MPRPECSACRHPQKDMIDEALRRGQPALRELARQTRLSRAALHRHSQHLAPVKGAANKDIATEIVKLRQAQAAARRRGDTAAVLSISREIRAWLALESKAESAAAFGSREEQGGAMTRAEAMETAKAIIEAEVAGGGEEVIAWLCGLLERAGATAAATSGLTGAANCMRTRDELPGEPLPCRQPPLVEAE